MAFGFKETLLQPGTKKRRKEHTSPPQVLTQDDERRFADLEAKDDLRAMEHTR